MTNAPAPIQQKSSTLRPASCIAFSQASLAAAATPMEIAAAGMLQQDLFRALMELPERERVAELLIHKCAIVLAELRRGAA